MEPPAGNCECKGQRGDAGACTASHVHVACPAENDVHGSGEALTDAEPNCRVIRSGSEARDGNVARSPVGTRRHYCDRFQRTAATGRIAPAGELGGQNGGPHSGGCAIIDM